MMTGKSLARMTITIVPLYTGRQVKYHGPTNQKEYFTERTESYFYRNVFYPFRLAELKEHAPIMHEVLVKV